MTEKQQLLIALRTGEMPAERSGEYWSEEELQLLKRLYAPVTPPRMAQPGPPVKGKPPQGGGATHP